MGLGTAKAHILGRQKKFYVTEEAVNGRYAEPVTGDSMNVLTSEMTPDRPRKPIMNAYLATRDVLEQITGKDSYAWSVNANYVPSGTKSIAPDCFPLLKALMGSQADNADDVTISQNSSQALDTLTLTAQNQDLWMETMSGCAVEEMTFTASGTEEPKIAVSGFGFDYGACGASAIDDNPLVIASNAFAAPADKGQNFHDPQDLTIAAGMYTGIYTMNAIDIGTSAPTAAITAFADYGDSTHVTVTSAAHTLAPGQICTISGTTNYNGVFRVGGTLGITSTNTFLIEDGWVADDATGTWLAQCHLVNDRTTDAITFSGKTSSEQAQEVVVAPFVPTHTDVGSPMEGISGSFSWDSKSDFAIKDFELVYKNNHKPTDDHALVPHTDDVIPGIRDINIKFTCRMRQDYIDTFLKRQDFVKDAVVITIGGAALSGTRLQITCSYVELKYNAVAIPESEEADVVFEGKCLGSSGNDAVVWVHT